MSETKHTKGELRFKELRVIDTRGWADPYKTVKKEKTLQQFDGFEWKDVETEQERIYID